MFGVAFAEFEDEPAYAQVEGGVDDQPAQAAVGPNLFFGDGDRVVGNSDKANGG